MPDTITNTRWNDYLKVAGMTLVGLLILGLAAWPHSNPVNELSTITPTAGYADYFLSGLFYIVGPGFYTISFILALFLFTPKAELLFWQVISFTVANFIAILLTINGLLTPPLHGIIELVLAMLVLFISLENIFSRTLHLSRFVVVLLFGFFHGMDFMRLLMQSDRPASLSWSTAAIFSTGLVLAQLAIVLPACFFVHKLIHPKPPYFRQTVLHSFSLLISFITLYWIVRIILL